MTYTTVDPFKDESPRCPAPPKTRVRVNWEQAAKRLAAGEPGDRIAAALGIAEKRLWRHFEKSLRFQFLFRQALERNRLSAQLAFQEAARQAVVQRCGRIDEIDAASWQWLARQTGITPDDREENGQEGSGSPPSGREVRLTAALREAAGRKPQNQAELRRLQKERRRMDAEFAELKAWGRAQGILPPAPEEAAASLTSQARQTGTSDDKAQTGAARNGSSADKTQTSENKTQISTETAAADTAEKMEGGSAPRIDGDDDDPPATPVRIPRFSDASPIDLTDMWGNPIPGREHLRR